jgi:hypothetical protein
MRHDGKPAIIKLATIGFTYADRNFNQAHIYLRSRSIMRVAERRFGGVTHSGRNEVHAQRILRAADFEFIRCSRA